MVPHAVFSVVPVSIPAMGCSPTPGHVVEPTHPLPMLGERWCHAMLQHGEYGLASFFSSHAKKKADARAVPWCTENAKPFHTLVSPEAPALSCPCQGVHHQCVTSVSCWVSLGSKVAQIPEQHAVLLGGAAGRSGVLLCRCQSPLEGHMHAGEPLASCNLGVAGLSPVAPQRKGTRDPLPCGGKFGTGSLSL